MPEAEAATYRFDRFDLTKVRPYPDYPLISIGRLVLNRVPPNFSPTPSRPAGRRRRRRASGDATLSQAGRGPCPAPAPAERRPAEITLDEA